MVPTNMLNNARLTVSDQPPYDALQSFVRENHIALKGSGKGNLEGLVFGVKDVFKILGSTYSNGHPEWLQTNGPDDFTSSIVTKTLSAGADLVGKTICDELCYSISGENWNYGSPINPHDPRRFTGGSSSGTGAATAGGLVDFAYGSDCLGSVRVPASYNGVLGIRPTYGRVANDGEAPYCESMDVLGYVARNSDVFRRVSKEVLGNDSKKVTFNRLLIADDCFDSINKDVVEALQPAVNHLKQHFEVVENIKVSPNGLEEWTEIFRIIQGYEVWESYGGWVRKYRPNLSSGPKERLEWASTITMSEYKEALNKRQAVIERVKDILPEGTLLCLPTAASVAPLRSSSLEEINATRAQSTKLLCISPLSGTPQVTLPLVKQHEVPLGISLIGAHDCDLQLAEFAADLVDSYSNANHKILGR
ncbi:amidase [Sporosarcina sp. Marseille-Q4943]|uniref:amidase n=1 Tax=Sporosarcina sp. Marseille-Q4943 TaxID=2942204 RepID=UPI00208DCAA2|nr:amidase [Sporosarcina sp. Marseille-Q4943]